MGGRETPLCIQLKLYTEGSGKELKKHRKSFSEYLYIYIYIDNGSRVIFTFAFSLSRFDTDGKYVIMNLTVAHRNSA